MSKKIVEEIIWEQLAPILEELAPIDAELLSEGVEDITPEAIEKAIKAFDINQKDFEKALESAVVEEDVRFFREYAEKIEGNTVEEKIKNLAQFLELDEEFRARILVDELPDPDEEEKVEIQKDPLTGIRDIRQIISKIIYIKTIAKILSKFDPTTAGTLMEPVFTSLGGAEYTLEGGAETLVDFKIGEELYSLKFVAGGGIDGSYNLLKKILLEDKKIKYIVALKTFLGGGGEGVNLEFREFTLDRTNFAEIMTAGAGGQFKFSTKPIKFSTKPTQDFDQNEEGLAGNRALQRFIYELNYSLGSREFNKLTGGKKIGTTVSDQIKSLFISSALAKRYEIKMVGFEEKILSLFPKGRKETRDAIERFLKDKDALDTVGEGVGAVLKKDSIVPEDEMIKDLEDFFQKLKIIDVGKKFKVEHGEDEVELDTASQFKTDFNDFMRKKIGPNRDLSYFTIKVLYDTIKFVEELDSVSQGTPIVSAGFDKLKTVGDLKTMTSQGDVRKWVEALKEYFVEMDDEERKFFKFFSTVANFSGRQGSETYVRTTSRVFDQIAKGALISIEGSKGSKGSGGSGGKINYIDDDNKVAKFLEILKNPENKKFEDALRRSHWPHGALLNAKSFGQHSKLITRMQIDTEKIVGVIQKLLEVKKGLLERNLKRYGYIQQQYQEMAINLSRFYNSNMKENTHAYKSITNSNEITTTLIGSMEDK